MILEIPAAYRLDIIVADGGRTNGTQAVAWAAGARVIDAGRGCVALREVSGAALASVSEAHKRARKRWPEGSVPLTSDRVENRMIQGSLTVQTDSESVEIRIARTESVRIEFLRCRTPATVKWNVVPSERSIVLGRNRTGDIRVSADDSGEKAPSRAGRVFCASPKERTGKAK